MRIGQPRALVPSTSSSQLNRNNPFFFVSDSMDVGRCSAIEDHPSCGNEDTPSGYNRTSAGRLNPLVRDNAGRRAKRAAPPAASWPATSSGTSTCPHPSTHTDSPRDEIYTTRNLCAGAHNRTKRGTRSPIKGSQPFTNAQPDRSVSASASSARTDRGPAMPMRAPSSFSSVSKGAKNRLENNNTKTGKQFTGSDRTTSFTAARQQPHVVVPTRPLTISPSCAHPKCVSATSMKTKTHLPSYKKEPPDRKSTAVGSSSHHNQTEIKFSISACHPSDAEKNLDVSGTAGSSGPSADTVVSPDDVGFLSSKDYSDIAPDAADTMPSPGGRRRVENVADFSGDSGADSTTSAAASALHCLPAGCVSVAASSPAAASPLQKVPSQASRYVKEPIFPDEPGTLHGSDSTSESLALIKDAKQQGGPAPLAGTARDALELGRREACAKGEKFDCSCGSSAAKGETATIRVVARRKDSRGSQTFDKTSKDRQSRSAAPGSSQKMTGLPGRGRVFTNHPVVGQRNEKATTTERQIRKATTAAVRQSNAAEGEKLHLRSEMKKRPQSTGTRGKIRTGKTFGEGSQCQSAAIATAALAATKEVVLPPRALQIFVPRRSARGSPLSPLASCPNLHSFSAVCAGEAQEDKAVVYSPLRTLGRTHHPQISIRNKSILANSSASSRGYMSRRQGNTPAEPDMLNSGVRYVTVRDVTAATGSTSETQTPTGRGAQSAGGGAESAADAAESAADAAESAADGAESAADGAESAADGAESAADGAESAADGAESAAGGAKSVAGATPHKTIVLRSAPKTALRESTSLRATYGTPDFASSTEEKSNRASDGGFYVNPPCSSMSIEKAVAQHTRRSSCSPQKENVSRCGNSSCSERPDLHSYSASNQLPNSPGEGSGMSIFHKSTSSPVRGGHLAMSPRESVNTSGRTQVVPFSFNEKALENKGEKHPPDLRPPLPQQQEVSVLQCSAALSMGETGVPAPQGGADLPFTRQASSRESSAERQETATAQEMYSSTSKADFRPVEEHAARAKREAATAVVTHTRPPLLFHKHEEVLGSGQRKRKESRASVSDADQHENQWSKCELLKKELTTGDTEKGVDTVSYSRQQRQIAEDLSLQQQEVICVEKLCQRMGQSQSLAEEEEEQRVVFEPQQTGVAWHPLPVMTPSTGPASHLQSEAPLTHYKKAALPAAAPIPARLMTQHKGERGLLTQLRSRELISFSQPHTATADGRSFARYEGASISAIRMLASPVATPVSSADGISSAISLHRSAPAQFWLRASSMPFFPPRESASSSSSTSGLFLHDSARNTDGYFSLASSSRRQSCGTSSSDLGLSESLLTNSAIHSSDASSLYASPAETPTCSFSSDDYSLHPRQVLSCRRSPDNTLSSAPRASYMLSPAYERRRRELAALESARNPIDAGTSLTQGRTCPSARRISPQAQKHQTDDPLAQDAIAQDSLAKDVQAEFALPRLSAGLVNTGGFFGRGQHCIGRMSAGPSEAQSGLRFLEELKDAPGPEGRHARTLASFLRRHAQPDASYDPFSGTAAGTTTATASMGDSSSPTPVNSPSICSAVHELQHHAHSSMNSNSRKKEVARGTDTDDRYNSLPLGAEKGSARIQGERRGDTSRRSAMPSSASCILGRESSVDSSLVSRTSSRVKTFGEGESRSSSGSSSKGHDDPGMTVVVVGGGGGPTLLQEDEEPVEETRLLPSRLVPCSIDHTRRSSAATATTVASASETLQKQKERRPRPQQALFTGHQQTSKQRKRISQSPPPRPEEAASRNKQQHSSRAKCRRFCQRPEAVFLGGATHDAATGELDLSSSAALTAETVIPVLNQTTEEPYTKPDTCAAKGGRRRFSNGDPHFGGGGSTEIISRTESFSDSEVDILKNQHPTARGSQHTHMHNSISADVNPSAIQSGNVYTSRKVSENRVEVAKHLGGSTTDAFEQEKHLPELRRPASSGAFLEETKEDGREDRDQVPETDQPRWTESYQTLLPTKQLVIKGQQQEPQESASPRGKEEDRKQWKMHIDVPRFLASAAAAVSRNYRSYFRRRSTISGSDRAVLSVMAAPNPSNQLTRSLETDDGRDSRNKERAGATKCLGVSGRSDYVVAATGTKLRRLRSVSAGFEQLRCQVDDSTADARASAAPELNDRVILTSPVARAQQIQLLGEGSSDASVELRENVVRDNAATFTPAGLGQSSEAGACLPAGLVNVEGKIHGKECSFRERGGNMSVARQKIFPGGGERDAQNQGQHHALSPCKEGEPASDSHKSTCRFCRSRTTASTSQLDEQTSGSQREGETALGEKGESYTGGSVKTSPRMHIPVSSSRSRSRSSSSSGRGSGDDDVLRGEGWRNQNSRSSDRRSRTSSQSSSRRSSVVTSSEGMRRRWRRRRRIESQSDSGSAGEENVHGACYHPGTYQNEHASNTSPYCFVDSSAGGRDIQGPRKWSVEDFLSHHENAWAEGGPQSEFPSVTLRKKLWTTATIPAAISSTCSQRGRSSLTYHPAKSISNCTRQAIRSPSSSSSSSCFSSSCSSSLTPSSSAGKYGFPFFRERKRIERRSHANTENDTVENGDIWARPSAPVLGWSTDSRSPALSVSHPDDQHGYWRRSGRRGPYEETGFRSELRQLQHAEGDDAKGEAGQRGAAEKASQGAGVAEQQTHTPPSDGRSDAVEEARARAKRLYSWRTSPEQEEEAEQEKDKAEAEEKDDDDEVKEEKEEERREMFARKSSSSVGSENAGAPSSGVNERSGERAIAAVPEYKEGTSRKRFFSRGGAYDLSTLWPTHQHEELRRGVLGWFRHDFRSPPFLFSSWFTAGGNASESEADKQASDRVDEVSEQQQRQKKEELTGGRSSRGDVEDTEKDTKDLLVASAPALSASERAAARPLSPRVIANTSTQTEGRSARSSATLTTPLTGGDTAGSTSTQSHSSAALSSRIGNQAALLHKTPQTRTIASYLLQPSQRDFSDIDDTLFAHLRRRSEKQDNQGEVRVHSSSSSSTSSISSSFPFSSPSSSSSCSSITSFPSSSSSSSSASSSSFSSMMADYKREAQTNRRETLIPGQRRSASAMASSTREQTKEKSLWPRLAAEARALKATARQVTNGAVTERPPWRRVAEALTASSRSRLNSIYQRLENGVDASSWGFQVAALSHSPRFSRRNTLSDLRRPPSPENYTCRWTAAHPQRNTGTQDRDDATPLQAKSWLHRSSPSCPEEKEDEEKKNTVKDAAAETGLQEGHDSGGKRERGDREEDGGLMATDAQRIETGGVATSSSSTAPDKKKRAIPSTQVKTKGTASSTTTEKAALLFTREREGEESFLAAESSPGSDGGVREDQERLTEDTLQQQAALSFAEKVGSLLCRVSSCSWLNPPARRPCHLQRLLAKAQKRDLSAAFHRRPPQRRLPSSGGRATAALRGQSTSSSNSGSGSSDEEGGTHCWSKDVAAVASTPPAPSLHGPSPENRGESKTSGKAPFVPPSQATSTTSRVSDNPSAAICRNSSRMSPAARRVFSMRASGLVQNGGRSPQDDDDVSDALQTAQRNRFGQDRHFIGTPEEHSSPSVKRVEEQEDSSVSFPSEVYSAASGSLHFSRQALTTFPEPSSCSRTGRDETSSATETGRANRATLQRSNTIPFAPEEASYRSSGGLYFAGAHGNRLHQPAAAAAELNGCLRDFPPCILEGIIRGSRNSSWLEQQRQLLRCRRRLQKHRRRLQARELCLTKAAHSSWRLLGDWQLVPNKSSGRQGTTALISPKIVVTDDHAEGGRERQEEDISGGGQQSEDVNEIVDQRKRMIEEGMDDSAATSTTTPRPFVFKSIKRNLHEREGDYIEEGKRNGKKAEGVIELRAIFSTTPTGTRRSAAEGTRGATAATGENKQANQELSSGNAASILNQSFLQDPWRMRGVSGRRASGPPEAFVKYVVEAGQGGHHMSASSSPALPRSSLMSGGRGQSAEGSSGKSLSSGRLSLWLGAYSIPRDDKRYRGGEDAWFLSSTCNAMGVADGVSEWEDLAGINPQKFAQDLMRGTFRHLRRLKKLKAIGLAQRIRAAAAAAQRLRGQKPMTAARLSNAQLTTEESQNLPSTAQLHLEEGGAGKSVSEAVKRGSSQEAEAPADDSRVKKKAAAAPGTADEDKQEEDYRGEEEQSSPTGEMDTKHERRGPVLDAAEMARIALTRSYHEAKHYGSSTALVGVLDERTGIVGFANLGDSSGMVLRRLRRGGGSGAGPGRSTLGVVRRVKEMQHSFNVPYQFGHVPAPEDWDRLRSTGLERLVSIAEKDFSQRRSQAAVADGPGAEPSESAIGDLPTAIEKLSVRVQEGDLILLGTDGLFDNVFDYEITALSGLALSPAEAKKLFLSTSHATPPSEIARALAFAAYWRSLDPKAQTPFSKETKKQLTLQGAGGGQDGWQSYLSRFAVGGKEDDITVVAAWVVTEADATQGRTGIGGVPSGSLSQEEEDMLLVDEDD